MYKWSIFVFNSLQNIPICQRYLTATEKVSHFSCCTPDILYTFTNKAETRKNTHLIFNMKVLLVN